MAAKPAVERAFFCLAPARHFGSMARAGKDLRRVAPAS